MKESTTPRRRLTAVDSPRPAPAPRGPKDAGSDGLPSAAKALLLLEVFIGGPPSLGVTEIARAAHISKSTAFRLLGILVDCGYVTRQGTRYCLGNRLFELGSHTSNCRPRSLRDIATPFLSELYAAYKSTIHLAILDGSEVLYLEKLHSPNQVNSPSHVGSRLPASLTAVGKALLAFSGPDHLDATLATPLPQRTRYSLTQQSLLLQDLEETRLNGYAVDREESTLGLVCYAAPILVNGKAVASVSICTTSSSAPSAPQLTSAVLSTAQKIRRQLPATFSPATA